MAKCGYYERGRNSHLQESRTLLCMRGQVKAGYAYDITWQVFLPPALPQQDLTKAQWWQLTLLIVLSLITNLSVKWDGGQAPLQRVQVKTEELLIQ